jgi:hypothetical protein
MYWRVFHFIEYRDFPRCVRLVCCWGGPLTGLISHRTVSVATSYLFGADSCCRAVSILDLCSVFLVSQRSPDFLFLFVLLAPGAWLFGCRPGGVTRTQGHPPQAADVLFVISLRSLAVPFGSSHRECCQAKTFSAYQDLIFFHVSKGARRPEILLSARGSVGTRHRLGSWSQHHFLLDFRESHSPPLLHQSA